MTVNARFSAFHRSKKNDVLGGRFAATNSGLGALRLYVYRATFGAWWLVQLLRNRTSSGGLRRFSDLKHDSGIRGQTAKPPKLWPRVHALECLKHPLRALINKTDTRAPVKPI
jgi:hypothetical protein